MDFFLKSRTRVICSAFGIFVCYFYFGILHERITRGTYGGECFQHVLALVLLLCVVNFTFATVVNRVVFSQVSRL